MQISRTELAPIYSIEQSEITGEWWICWDGKRLRKANNKEDALAMLYMIGPQEAV